MESTNIDSFSSFHGKGVVSEPLTVVITKTGRKVYSSVLKIMRQSGIYDFVPIYVYDENLKREEIYNKFVEVTGIVKTRNFHTADGKSHLKMYVNITSIKNISDDIPEDAGAYVNDCHICGYMCKDPVLRTTPLGKNITDMLIATNYKESKNSFKTKASYIPVIAWNNVAIGCSYRIKGSKIRFKGRFQSRDYHKEEKIYTTYEISIYAVLEIDEIPENGNNGES